MEETIYPKHDENFEETTIKNVEQKSSGWNLTFIDEWILFVSNEYDVIPKPGMEVRLYSEGTGHVIRGLYIDGKKVFYRNKIEQEEFNKITSYGKDAKDWLQRWDNGQIIWSIEMGGLGPGYEQAIQITTAEILRIMIESEFDHDKWDEPEKWQEDKKQVTKASLANSTINNLGLSGAQFGAAYQLAAKLYSYGPQIVMTDEAVKDRHIQVSKNFP